MDEEITGRMAGGMGEWRDGEIKKRKN